MSRKVIFVTIVLLSVLGCMMLCLVVISITPAGMEHRIRRVAATLPHPEGAKLLLERFRNVSGSSCRAMAYYQVYGSSTEENIALAPYLYALSKAGWEEKEIDESQYLPRFRGKIVGLFRKGSYSLTIRWVDLQEAILWTGTHKQQDELETQAGTFKAFLMVELYLIGPCID